MYRIVLVIILAAGLVVLFGSDNRTGGASEPSKPFGIAKRVPLTTSRVVGSPDPPPPFRTRRAFPKLSFKLPVYLTHEPNTDRLFVVEQNGRIVAFKNDPATDKTDLFCQIEDHDTYSMIFHPDYAKNGFVYLFSNGLNSAERKKNHIFRFTVKRDGSRCCDPDSRQLVIEWESNGHNGGDMAFGLDGYLYLSAGDGTSDSDGDLTGQDLRDLCSAIIRIDVNHPDPGKGYSVPKDNPFLKTEGARPELWAFGLRNPWRMSLDRETGNLWVGDVGQDLWEMVHIIQRGGNYGWSVYEGSHPFQLNRKRGPGPILKPIMEHPHSESRSLTGGHVYRGKKFKDLQGAYVYGDYSTGKIWELRYENGKVTWQKDLASTRLQIVGIGKDRAGELYFVDHGGGKVEELEPMPADLPRTAFPRKLSETGLFLSTAENKPQPGLIPYSVNAPLWSDGAAKERFIGLPGEERIDFTEEGAWRFPEKTVLVKTFALETEAGNPASRRRIETRLLTLQEGEWYGYSYLWDDKQADAELVPAAGLDREYAIKEAGGTRKQVWHFPSRTECMVCHSRAAAWVLGLSTPQMNKIHHYGPVADNQLRTLEHLGVFRVNGNDYRPAWWPTVRDLGFTFFQPVRKAVQTKWDRWAERFGPVPSDTTRLPGRPEDFRRLADPYDGAADLNERARSYLHANCAQCHVMAGGGNSAIDLYVRTPRENMQLIGVKPQHDTFGLRDALLVAPGEPERSVLHYRVSKRGPGQMPPLASSVVDEQAAKLLADWIRQMKAK
jgi:glucose/arabinose dehydrogenase/mono/diheme cytochrome c family protein